jgi:hypothetical protein
MSQSEYDAARAGQLDAAEITEIDRSDPVQRWRYTCPRGHLDWDKTNAHIWCRGCRRQHEAGEDIHPEHWEIHDKQRGESIPWDAVRLQE